MEEVTEHPYIPRDLKLDEYVAISMSMTSILTIYHGALLFVVTLSWFLFGKEYSKGDSRYAGRDSAIIAVKGIIVVIEGHASLLVV
ncbi:unnamed protein product [Cochlearia groenlandica]